MVFNDFKNKLANLVFLRQSVPTMPKSFWIGFSTTIPNEDGTNITQPSSSYGYARKQLTLGNLENGTVSNTAEISYGTATGSWGDIKYTVIFDETGKPLFADPIVSKVHVDAGDIVKIRIGDAKLYFGDAAVWA